MQTVTRREPAASNRVSRIILGILGTQFLSIQVVLTHGSSQEKRSMDGWAKFSWFSREEITMRKGGGSQTDVGSGSEASDWETSQWKPVMCYAHGRMADNEKHGGKDSVKRFFEPIEPKEIRRDVSHGKRRAVEISFRTGAGFIQALEKSNIDHVVSDRARITLKRPEEALEEMTSTEYFWTMDEILWQLVPFYWGRLFKGVSRSWKGSLERERRSSGGLFVVPDYYEHGTIK
ncbi:hypothetical protein RvY_15304 [Ramazzottius varieornatus]|uniref:Uncharacterized protein n=1 Tax=Ramazzottius varieornatus TaxID=947166 RepID=A0A1D1VZ68_RAMVA|nr:hypothetical protein RvY_15304 [Ramazzottius varieornatus]